MATKAQEEQARGAAAPVSLENMLSLAFGAMREQAADAGHDDWYEVKSRDILGQRPVVLDAVALPDQTVTWLMHGEHDVVVTTDSHIVWEKDGTCRRFRKADTEMKGFLLHEIEQRVSWLVKEATGEGLAEREAIGANKS